MRLIFFVEEDSMKVVLEHLLPMLGLEDKDFLIISHQGATDLERKLRIRLRGWGESSDKFIILRDNDNGDCVKRKQKLLDISNDAQKLDRTYVRIVCQELEAWFLGDQQAIVEAGYIGNTKVRQHDNVDVIDKPSRRLFTHLKGYQKMDGARRIATTLVIERNSSQSFQVFVSLIRALT